MRLRGIGRLRAGGALSSAVAQYTGQSASNCFLPSTFNSVLKQMMTRTSHINRSNGSTFQVAFPNFYVEATGTGASATVTASIEYPAGTFTQLLFSGSSSGTITSGSFLVSDTATVSIPYGSQFWVRQFFTNTAGIIYKASNYTLANGDAMTYAVSGLTDQTMGGTVTMTGSTISGPCAIIGTMVEPSLALIGDSRCQGVGDTNSSGVEVGELARSLATRAYINLGVSGARADQLAAAGSTTVRAQLATYCYSVICEMGTNDLAASITAANLLTSIQTIRNWFPTKSFYQSTISPRCTATSDGWTTVPGQTTFAQEPARITANASIRAVPAWMTGFLEVADQVESARDSGKWKAPGYTADGVHETPTGYAAITSSGAINYSNLH